jgi:hypothetical protein
MLLWRVWSDGWKILQRIENNDIEWVLIFNLDVESPTAENNEFDCLTV